MKRILFFVGLLASTSSASAFCFQGSDINGALDYLVCLHNEQSDTLSNHARLINQHADVIQQQASTIDELRNDLDQAERNIRDLRQELDSLTGLVRSMQP